MSEIRELIYQFKQVKIIISKDSTGNLKFRKDGSLNIYTYNKVTIGETSMMSVDSGITLQLKKHILNPLHYYLDIRNDNRSELIRRGIFIPEYAIDLPNNKPIKIFIPFVNMATKALVLPIGGLLAKAYLQSYIVPHIIRHF